MPVSPPALRPAPPSKPLERLGGGGVGSVARCHNDDDRLLDWREDGSVPGGGVSEPERRLPREELGEMELEGDSVPQSGFDCPDVKGPLVRRESWRELPMPDAPGEMPGNCPV